MDVRMRDGTIIKNVPEGTTQEELMSRLGKAQGLGAAASFDIPEDQPSASRSEYLANSAKRGVENLLTFGPSVLETITGASGRRDLLEKIAPGPRNPTATEALQNAYRGITGTNVNMEAPDALTRYGGKALEFGVSGAPFALRSVVGAAHRVPAALAELGSAAGGGVGFELGGDVGQGLGGETGKNIGQFVGSVGGSIAGMASPITFSKIWSLAPTFSAEGRKNAINQLAGKKLGGAMNASPATAGNIVSAEDVTTALQQKGAGEFRPTLGQVTGAEGVQSIEGSIARKTPEDVGQYAQRMSENRSVIENAKNIDFPAGGDFQRGAESVTRNTIKKLDTRLDNVLKAQEAIASRVAGGSQQAAGERLLQLRDEAQNAARASKNAKLADIYATADRLKINEDMSDAVTLVKKLGGDDKNTFQNMPPVFRKVMEEYAPKEKELTGRSIPPDLMAASGIGAPPKAASFQEVHSLWRETNSQLATAQRVGDTNATYYLEQLKNTLRSKLDKYEQGGQGELADKFRDFNKWFATKYAPAFYEGVGGRMSATTRFGEMVKPEDIVGKFFTPSGVDDFNLIYSGNQNAQSSLRDGVLGLFAEKAVKGGKIDPNASANFLRLNAETLDKLPDIKATLSNAAATNEALLQRAQRLREGQTQVTQSAVAKIANTDNPDALVQSAMTDRQKMMSLIASAKDASSRASVLRSIADNVTGAAEKAGLDPLAFVVKNEDALKPALNRLGSGHYENLKLLANAETILARTDVPAHAVTPKMSSAIEDTTGSSPRTIWAQSANAAAGRQSYVSGALHLLSKFGIRVAENKTDEVLREVIYNPSLARDLVNLSGRPLTVGVSNKISEHLKNAGIRVFLEND